MPVSEPAPYSGSSPLDENRPPGFPHCSGHHLANGWDDSIVERVAEAIEPLMRAVEVLGPGVVKPYLDVSLRHRPPERARPW